MAVLFGGACDEGEGGVRERIEGNQLFSTAQDELSFEVLLPDYLPRGTQEPPIISWDAPYTITFWFLGERPTTESGRPAPDVHIRELLLSSEDPPPVWFSTPNLSATSVNGYEARYRKTEGGSSSSMQLFSETEVVSITLSLE